MRNLKKTRRIQVIVITTMALIASVVVAYIAAPNALQYFRSPTQVVNEKPPESETFRIGGLVEKGSLVRGSGETVTFKVTDTKTIVPVSYTGVLPDLFGEGQGMIGTGHMQGETFIATEILAKHDETYMPKEVIDALKEQGTYVDPKAQAGAAPATN